MNPELDWEVCIDGEPAADGSDLDGTVQADESRVGYLAVKRVFDVVFSAVVLILLWWLLVLIALVVKLEEPSAPAVFRQRRVSRTVNGEVKTFTMLKFRTMVPNAEGLLEDLRERNEKTGPVFKIKDDPRVTRVGRILRKTSLDELPQFLNVLAGDMSVVGPRPALPAEVENYTLYEMGRLAVKAGITCYWQARHDRDTISFDEWVDLDLQYVENRGIWTDVKLIVRTVGVVLTGEGS